MSTHESFRALRRANPRGRPGFARAVENAAETLGDRIASAEALGGDRAVPRQRIGLPRAPRGLVRVAAAGVAFAAVAVAAALSLDRSPDGSGVANAAAAVRAAAAVTAAAAERSGTAVVRVTHGGELWAARGVRWHGEDVAMSSEHPRRETRPGSDLLVVDGRVYGRDVDGGWLMMGSPANIDADSGTTPDEYLAAVREDVGGATLRRITDGMKTLTARRLGDGSTTYRGAVAAGLVARETGFKEGRELRVLPFGYVAHGEAADPSAPLDTAVTVGADGVLREIAVRWGAGRSAWTYTVTYTRLGETAPVVAPANARSLLRERLRSAKLAGGG